MSFDLEDRVTLTPKPAFPAAGTKSPPNVRELQSSGDIRILILDDDPGICAFVRAALADRDFVVDEVTDPQRVEAALGRRAAPDAPGYYHLIVLDYVLPGLEPDQVFAWIRDGQPDATIVVVSGYPTVDSVLNCLRARTHDYLTKPFQVDKLREVVFRCLENKGLLRMTEDALKEALGTAIRARRKALSLTLADLSKKTEVSLGYLSQIELGKNSASIETLYKICLALGMKMSELFQAVQRS